MKKTKTQNGITLIALIITIIVLLILAVVTINSLEEGGIITHAENAANIYKQAQIDEEISLFEMETYMNTQKKFSEATKERISELCKATGVTPKQLTVHYNASGSEYVLYRIDKTTESERQALEAQGAKALMGDIDFDGVLTLNDAKLLEKADMDGMINGEEWFDENGELKEKFKLGDIDNDGALGGSDAGNIEYIISGGEYTGGYIE